MNCLFEQARGMRLKSAAMSCRLPCKFGLYLGSDINGNRHWRSPLIIARSQIYLIVLSAVTRQSTRYYPLSRYKSTSPHVPFGVRSEGGSSRWAASA